MFFYSISDARSKAIIKSKPGLYSCCIIRFSILLLRYSYSPENPRGKKSIVQILRVIWQHIETGKLTDGQPSSSWPLISKLKSFVTIFIILLC